MADDDEAASTGDLFELEITLPDPRLKQLAERLVGFQARYARIHAGLRLLIDGQGLAEWSSRLYGANLPLLDVLVDSYPLAIFHGDVGTGKTATAEAVSDALAREIGRDGMLFKLSTRVRGAGTVGQMSTLINRAFAAVNAQAGKKRVCYLIIDEADSLAASRNQGHSHHEDKVAVNTIIQKVDDLRKLGGRLLVILCTNRFAALDPAVVRRASWIEEFCRPGDAEREAVFRMDLTGLGLGEDVLEELVRLTGPSGECPLGFTYSDLRTRLLPAAVARAFPERRLSAGDLLEVARGLKPSPAVA
jgi:AAA+ superfamily predicted ATPase